LACAALLTAMSLSVAVAQHALRIDVHPSVARAFDLDEELNVPTAYQSATLLGSSVLLFSIARQTRRAGRPHAGYWVELALVFLFLFLDESVRIHERVGQFRDYLPFQAGRLVRSGWVMFGVVFVVVIAIVNLRFLLNLPRRTALALVIAGCVYVAGAVGMEIAAGPWITAHGRDNVGYALLASLEEALEMTGVIIFIHALLAYRRRCEPAAKPSSSEQAGPASRRLSLAPVAQSTIAGAGAAGRPNNP
jgi:hypothetical protein